MSYEPKAQGKNVHAYLPISFDTPVGLSLAVFCACVMLRTVEQVSRVWSLYVICSQRLNGILSLLPHVILPSIDLLMNLIHFEAFLFITNFKGKTSNDCEALKTRHM